MSKHTPGPWTANEEFDDGESLGIAITAGRLGQVVRVFDVGQEGFANAHLIAAAPDLLEALQNLTACCFFPTSGNDAFQTTVDRARTALVKATGEAA